MPVRILLSVIALVAYWAVNFISNPVVTLIQGQNAGQQFQNSDSAYLNFWATWQLAPHFGISAIVLLALLAWIWWGAFFGKKAT